MRQFEDFKYVLFKILASRAYNPPARQHGQFSKSRPDWLRCLVGRIYALFAGISCKTYLFEFLKVYRSPLAKLNFWFENEET